MLNPNQLQNNENEEDPPETIKNLQVSTILTENTRFRPFEGHSRSNQLELGLVWAF